MSKIAKTVIAEFIDVVGQLEFIEIRQPDSVAGSMHRACRTYLNATKNLPTELEEMATACRKAMAASEQDNRRTLQSRRQLRELQEIITVGEGLLEDERALRAKRREAAATKARVAGIEAGIEITRLRKALKEARREIRPANEDQRVRVRWWVRSVGGGSYRLYDSVVDCREDRNLLICMQPDKGSYLDLTGFPKFASNQVTAEWLRPVCIACNGYGCESNPIDKHTSTCAECGS